MKKTLLGIAGILAMISSANAIDTAQIKAACQSSDKTLWVERNQVCIPRNPCDNPNYEQYCNREFSNLQMVDREYEGIINYFAKVKNLDCKAVPQKSKLAGQDYVVCMGTDVMVFEFDDISNKWEELRDCISDGARKAACIIMGGTYGPNDLGCYGASENDCMMFNEPFSLGETAVQGDPLPFADWSDYNGPTCYLGCPGRFM